MPANKRFIKSLSNFIRSNVSEQLGLEKAVLFGSYAKGTQRKYSDIDIALVSPAYDSCDYLNEIVKASRLFFDFDMMVEPHLFTPQEFASDDMFQTEIRRTGVPLFERV